MCGRYTLSTPADLLADLFQLESAVALQPRFNIAPTQLAPVVRTAPDSHSRHMDLLRWGLVPFWAKDPAIGNRMINARSETVAEKPAYRTSFKRKRCLVLADGFYEWKVMEQGPKQPFFFHRQDGRPFAMAGLWDRWEGSSEEPLESFTILTTSANTVVSKVHHRMPVLLDSDAIETWLAPSVQSPDPLIALLGPSETALEAVPVTTYVNSPGNEGAGCIEPMSL